MVYSIYNMFKDIYVYIIKIMSDKTKNIESTLNYIRYNKPWSNIYNYPNNKIKKHNIINNNYYFINISDKETDDNNITHFSWQSSEFPLLCDTIFQFKIKKHYNENPYIKMEWIDWNKNILLSADDIKYYNIDNDTLLVESNKLSYPHPTRCQSTVLSFRIYYDNNLLELDTIHETTIDIILFGEGSMPEIRFGPQQEFIWDKTFTVKTIDKPIEYIDNITFTNSKLRFKRDDFFSYINYNTIWNNTISHKLCDFITNNITYTNSCTDQPNVLSHQFEDDIIQQKLSNELPKWIKILPIMRAVKYKEGTSFRKHIDTSINNSIYALRLLIYLNDDFTGGETYFSEKNISIIPVKGKCVVFNMFLPHEVNTITSGTKEILACEIEII